MKILDGYIIADEINGTCQDLEAVIERFIEEDGYTLPVPEITMYEQLDNICFCCEQCGWWCDIGDQADDDTWRCSSCQGED